FDGKPAVGGNTGIDRVEDVHFVGRDTPGMTEVAGLLHGQAGVISVPGYRNGAALLVRIGLRKPEIVKAQPMLVRVVVVSFGKSLSLRERVGRSALPETRIRVTLRQLVPDLRNDWIDGGKFVTRIRQARDRVNRANGRFRKISG